MEPRITNYAPLSEVLSADLNNWQSQSSALRAGNGSNVLVGMDCYGEQQIATVGTTTTFAMGSPNKIDTSFDWRDRFLSGVFVRLTADTDLPGEASDARINERTRTLGLPSNVHRQTFDMFYSGTGALNAAGGGVTAGSPPVNTNTSFNSYAVPLDFVEGGTAVFWLYADDVTGALCVYNNTASNVAGFVLVKGSGLLNQRP